MKSFERRSVCRTANCCHRIVVIAQQLESHIPIPASNDRRYRTLGSDMARMDDQMKKMQALHERMASAATPEERQKLMCG